MPLTRGLAVIVWLASGSNAAICNDEDISCANWARDDQCGLEGAGLKSLCPVSCRTCLTPMDCKETKEECEQWARA